MSIRKIVTTKWRDDEWKIDYMFEPIEDTIKLIKGDGGKFNVYYLTQDKDYESPDENPGAWGDDGMFLVHYHRDFYIKREDVVTENDIQDWYQGKKIEQENDYHIFPVSALIHSWVWLSLGLRPLINRGLAEDGGGWDTSHVGAVLVSKKEWETEEKAEKAAEGLVEAWNQSLSGDVYGVVVEYYNYGHERIDHDALWGCYGFDYAKKVLANMLVKMLRDR